MSKKLNVNEVKKEKIFEYKSIGEEINDPNPVKTSTETNEAVSIDKFDDSLQSSSLQSISETSFNVRVCC